MLAEYYKATFAVMLGTATPAADPARLHAPPRAAERRERPPARRRPPRRKRDRAPGRLPPEPLRIARASPSLLRELLALDPHP